MLLAALLVTAEAALQSFSKSRAHRLLDEGRGGAKQLVPITEDPAPTLNTLLFVRILAEIVAIVMVAPGGVCSILTGEAFGRKRQGAS